VSATALLDAVTASCEAAEVEQLIARGAKVDGADVNKQTALHQAATAGRIDIVRILLAAGADTGKRDFQKCTPLHYALTVDVARCLVEGGADCRAVDEGGGGVAHHAALVGASDLVRYAVELGAPCGADKYGNTVLHAGAGKLDVASLDALAARGVDVNAASSLGLVPLLIAAQSAFNAELAIANIDWLIAHGARRDAVDRGKRNALHLACQSGHLAVVRHLVEKHGFHPDDAGRKGDTAFLFACQVASDAIVEYLVACGADVARLDADGGTALHCGASNRAPGGGAAVLARVLALGLDVNAKDASDLTALDHAAEYTVDKVELLLAHGATVNAAALQRAKSRPEVLAALRAASGKPPKKTAARTTKKR
jgi:ankyrin repeat protein